MVELVIGNFVVLFVDWVYKYFVGMVVFVLVYDCFWLVVSFV